MGNLSFRLWLLVSLTLALGAVMVRLVWEFAFSTAVGSIVIVVLLILVTLSIYALSLYLIIKPGLKKAKSLPVRIWITVMISAGLASGIIHYIRFVPSPEASSPLSVVIATLLLLAGISAYLLVLWLIWKTKT